MRDFWARYRWVLLVVTVGLLLRAWAGWQLPLDADEPVYLQAAYDYARLVRAGDLASILDYPINQEHPPLIKLIYSLTVLAQGGNAPWEVSLFLSRAVSVFFGTLAVWLVALINPLAGGLLAIQTTAVKYTSEVYLEALPHFFSLLAVFALLRSRAQADRSFWLSAVALGLTAAGKYSYVPILVVVLYVLLWEKRYAWKSLAPYLITAGLVFLAFNPALWPDPVDRLLDSLLFHSQYSRSAHVQISGYPWYQPFIWVSRSMPVVWHPDVYFYFGVDGLIAILAVIGLKPAWSSRRWAVVWLAAGMLALLAWPTKWPQYTLVVLPALCILAAEAAILIYQRIKEEDMYWNWISEMIPRPSRGMVLAFVVLGVLVLLGQVYNTVRYSWLNRGWWLLTPENSLLPSYTVYSVLAGDDHQMILGTEGGLAFVHISPDTNLPEDWQVFNQANSPLPTNRILSMEREAGGALWLGTPTGVIRLENGSWQVFRSGELGLAGEQIQDMELTEGGRLWVGTDAGLSMWNGQAWQPFGLQGLNLEDTYITALANDPRPGENTLWVASLTRVYRINLQTSQWEEIPVETARPNAGSISDLMLDSQGRLWVAKLGDGLHRFDGEDWTAFRVSNSEIPSNTVDRIEELQPGRYWVATTDPAEAGGVLASFDGQTWYAYTSSNSGYSGAEPLSLAAEAGGRLWIGTRTAGVYIYQWQDRE